MYKHKRASLLENLVYVQIPVYHSLNFVVNSNFFEVFSDPRGTNLSEKCADIKCCIELISDMSKIWAFYLNVLHSERVITSMANWLVFLFKQITVRYPCVANSESYDRALQLCRTNSPSSLEVSHQRQRGPLN